MAGAQDTGISASVSDVTATATVGSSTNSVVSAAPAGGQSAGGGQKLSLGMQFAGSGAFGTSSHKWGVPLSAAGTLSMGRAAGLTSENAPGMGSGRSSLGARQLSALSATSSINPTGSTKTPIHVQSNGSAVYSTGFPDSTKGTGGISPPEGMNSNIFDFAPAIPGAFPDMSNREFLLPSLQVSGTGAGRSSQGGQEDLYKKLRKHLEASHKGSLKSKSSKHTPAMTDSLKRSSSLKSAKSSGLTF
jgi:hypothetical protein